MEKNNKKTYWPHMIVGFLMLAFMLSFWTVKSASSIPVQESNNFMLKYQQADLNINEILESKALFDQNYKIELVDVKTMVIDLENAKRAKKEKVVQLSMGNNSFDYSIKDKKGMIVNDANVTFLLTRPHTREEDRLIENIKVNNGKYVVENMDITKAGRYTLQLKVKMDNAIGYSEIPAYLEP
jgi:hypothetical protein